MSIDLDLLPYTCDEINNTFSHAVLPLETNSHDLFDEISKLLTVKCNSLNFITEQELTGEVGERFRCYLAKGENDEPTYGFLNEDAYGKKVMWIRASLLQGLANHDDVKCNDLNRQAWGYINACPSSMKIALFWH